MDEPHGGPSSANHLKNAIYNVDVDNSFSDLSDESDNNEILNMVDNKKKKRKRVVNSNSDEPSIKKTARIEKQVRKTKMPPINVYNLNVKSATEAIKSKMAGSFTIKNVNKNLTLIYTESVEDHTSCLAVLKELGNHSYTYTPDELKPINLLLRGIHRTYDENEVVEQLKQLKLSNNDSKVVNAFKYNTIKSKKENRDLMLYMVQFSPMTKIQDVMKTKFFMNQKIEWEIMKKHEIIQCKRCQRYGHSAKNCAMPYRCVKCTENHLPGECLLKKCDEVMPHSKENEESNIASKTEPSCVNCGQSGHPANYRNCPMYKNIMRRKQERINDQRIQQEQRNRYISNHVKQNMSYSKVVNSNLNNLVDFPQLNKTRANINYNLENVENNNSNAFSFFESECQKMFGSDFFTLIGKVQEFIPIYKQITSTAQKQITLLKFMLTLVDLNNG